MKRTHRATWYFKEESDHVYLPRFGQTKIQKDNRQHHQRILGREMALWTLLLSILSLKLFICCLSHMLSYRLPGFKLNPLPALPIKHKGIPDRFLSNTTVFSTWEKLVLSRCFSLRQNTGLGGAVLCTRHNLTVSERPTLPLKQQSSLEESGYVIGCRREEPWEKH